MRHRSRSLLLAALFVATAWTLTRPADFDEVNFLTLARGAVQDLWRPHDIAVNWQGTTEPAFGVLSNPPGIAWWLAPVVGLPVWAQRLWMLPWTVLAAWGAGRLGQRFLGNARTGEVLVLTAPIVLLSASALSPDAPLLACCVAGMAGYLDAVERGERAWPWALLLGAGALFRYSAVALWPLVLLWPLLQRRSVVPALAAGVPLGLLAAHDLHAYGEIHLFAMSRFQAVANTPLDWGHKAVAAVTMLGGVAALPVFKWRKAHWVAAAVGAVAALSWGPVAGIFGALGGAALAPALLALGSTTDPRPRPDRLLLTAWVLLGFVFLLTLRFSAARYWLPFLPAVLLLMPNDLPRWRAALGLCLGLTLATDGAWQARATAGLAEGAAAVAAKGGGAGRFTGHWGWQGVLESRGWTALDEEEAAAPGALVAVPSEAWPQSVSLRCREVLWEGVASAPSALVPRGYSGAVGANLHASWNAGPPPIRTVIPWWFADDPYERARVCRE
ncbi:MAG: hypothetical protein EXR71_16845 [Myxococcales bacterium]|nr:hypothetical protein [Myxococcales bacterium]